jgi:hypothetical protein
LGMQKAGEGEKKQGGVFHVACEYEAEGAL